MARLSTCKKCGIQIPKEQGERISNKFYCKNCAEQIQIEKSQNAKQTDKNNSEYKSLISYICTIYNVKKPDVQMFAQIKRMKNKGITYAQMEYTLWYLLEITQTFSTNYKLGQIENNLEKAKEYAIEKSLKEEQLSQKSPNDIKNIIKTYKRKITNNTELLLDVSKIV